MQVPRQVIVVGAGLSGLAAARALAASGIEVVVIEARDRIGGRIWTEDGIDLGAHWIHGTEGNPVTNLARELSVPTVFVGGDSSYTGGWEHLELRSSSAPVDQATKEKSITMIDEIRDAVEALRRDLELGCLPDIPLAEAIERVIEGRGFSPELRTHLTWHMLVMSRDDWAADLDQLSTLWWDDGYEIYGYGDSVFPDGVGMLVERLASGLDIRLGSSVRSIDYREQRVQVRTDAEVFAADAAIVTLPLGVLKSGTVGFDPPLPEPKRQAVTRLGMGTLAKVVLTFEAPFWPRNQYVFGRLSHDVAETPTVIISMWKTHRKPVLVMLIGGRRGLEIESWPAEDASAWSARVLRDMFGEIAPMPIRVEVTSWSRDPFSLGAYSYIAHGSTPDDIEALAQPVVDRLFFAGEATSRIHWGALQGAYVSGLREAARLAGDPSILPGRNFTENRRWREMLQRANRFFDLARRNVDAEELASRVDVLSRSPVFGGIAAGDLRMLATMFGRCSLGEGEILCHADDPADSVFAIASGAVEVLLPGGPTPVALKRAGEIVGEFGMFLGGRRSATLRAAEATDVLVLDYEHFRRFLLAFPQATLTLLAQMVTRAHAGEAAAERGNTG